MFSITSLMNLRELCGTCIYHAHHLPQEERRLLKAVMSSQSARESRSQGVQPLLAVSNGEVTSIHNARSELGV